MNASIQKKNKPFIITFIIILILLTILSERIYYYFIKKDASNDPIIEINWDQIWSWEETSTTWFQFLEWCNYQEYLDKYKDTEYKILSVFWEPRRSPTDFSNHRLYTNVFNISWHIDEAYLCISSNVVPYRQNNKFYYTTYVLFNESKYAGHIRVWYNKSKKILYDHTSNNANSKLTWRFRWSEVPKIYQENLNKIIVANPSESWSDYKDIYPIERLKKEWRIVIWWFVNASNNEWILEEFLIIYKWGVIEKR